MSRYFESPKGQSSYVVSQLNSNCFGISFHVGLCVLHRVL
jgi:hypothetical protein